MGCAVDTAEVVVSVRDSAMQEEPRHNHPQANLSHKPIQCLLWSTTPKRIQLSSEDFYPFENVCRTKKRSIVTMPSQLELLYW